MKIILIGAGGHSKVVAEAAIASGFEIYGLCDSNLKVSSKYQIFEHENFPEFLNNGVLHAFVCFVGIKNMAARQIKFEELVEAGFKLPVLCHATAVISESAKISGGTLIAARAVVNPCAKIGKNCIINTGAIVEHDACLSENVHISPGAVVCGAVKIGKNCFIGANATLVPNIEIADDIIIGAGSTVVKSIKAPGIYVGSPAKKISVNQEN